MQEAPIADMSSGIISLWFRDARKRKTPPPQMNALNEGWPIPVPPDTDAIVQTLTPSSVFWWNSYGRPLLSGIYGPAPLLMPVPPPISTDNMSMLLVFGDANQKYNYCPWLLEFPSVVAAVDYLQTFLPAEGADVWPAPYAPYNKELGDSAGLFRVANMALTSASPQPAMVPQSFIGVDKDGFLIICLQTRNAATYKGCAYSLKTIEELWAGPTLFKVDGPPNTYNQIGFPFPDGHWEAYPGYWNGYQFHYEDVSNQIMGVQPEYFILGGPGVLPDLQNGPQVGGQTWHHLLLSFDIKGSVDTDHVREGNNIFINAVTHCKAWLAVDDVNYTGMQLQKRIRTPDGFLSPLLPGMGSDVIPFGPSTSASRTAFRPALGPNDILPQNAWIRGFGGFPKEGLLRFSAACDIIETERVFEDGQKLEVGDFNRLAWTGNIWPLYGEGKSPGPWLAELDPPRPTAPDPKDFDVPTYSCPSFAIPTKGHMFGVPSSSRHLQHNTGIEMSELQIWVNKSIDTNITGNRRLFIDMDGKPVDMSVAEKVLGEPDIKLHGTGNWQKGYNTGSAGVEINDKDEPVKKPNGQFVPVSTIDPFKPDPELGK